MNSSRTRSPGGSNVRLWLQIAVLTVVFELLTCALRFGARLQSTRDTASTIGRLTCGLRIHHSYIGAVMMLVAAAFWNSRPRAAWWLLAVGAALFLSDLIHHFLVLWPLVGSPEFHLTYPPTVSAVIFLI